MIGCGTEMEAPGATVTIVGFSPADATAHVSPRVKISIALSGDADADSISNTTVHVRIVETKQEMRGTVSYDADHHAIAFAPSPPLDLDAVYRITVDGATAGGAPIPPASATFRTLANPQLSETGFDALGAVVQRSTFDHDMDGRMVQETTYAPGPDGMLGTGDDQIQAWRARSYPTSSVTRDIFYDSPGPDGRWHTEDDVITRVIDRIWFARPLLKSYIVYGGPGGDGQWLTADDAVAERDDYARNDLDLAVAITTRSTGLDGQVGTSDDAERVSVLRYSDPPFPTWLEQDDYDGPGPDGIWGTADDHSDGRTTYERDALGNAVTEHQYLSGPDGIPGTSDDQENYRIETHYDEAGAFVSDVSISGPGDDGVWGTADDHATGSNVITYDNGGWRTVRTFSAGDDGIANTSDDYLRYEQTFDPSL